jgi:hypothetical protein
MSVYFGGEALELYRNNQEKIEKEVKIATQQHSHYLQEQRRNKVNMVTYRVQTIEQLCRESFEYTFGAYGRHKKKSMTVDIPEGIIRTTSPETITWKANKRFETSEKFDLDKALQDILIDILVDIDIQAYLATLELGEAKKQKLKDAYNTLRRGIWVTAMKKFCRTPMVLMAAEETYGKIEYDYNNSDDDWEGEVPLEVSANDFIDYECSMCASCYRSPQNEIHICEGHACSSKICSACHNKERRKTNSYCQLYCTSCAASMKEWKKCKIIADPPLSCF